MTRPYFWVGGLCIWQYSNDGKPFILPPASIYDASRELNSCSSYDGSCDTEYLEMREIDLSFLIPCLLCRDRNISNITFFMSTDYICMNKSVISMVRNKTSLRF